MATLINIKPAAADRDGGTSLARQRQQLWEELFALVLEKTNVSREQLYEMLANRYMNQNLDVLTKKELERFKEILS